LDGLELLIQEGGRGRLVRLQLCGVAAIFAGNYGWGVRLVGHCTSEHARTGEVRGPTEQRLVDEALAFAATRCKPEEIAAWLADGTQWSVDRIVALIRNKIVPLLTASVETDDAGKPQGDEPAGTAKSTRSGD
jgi:hypothetical protein